MNRKKTEKEKQNKRNNIFPFQNLLKSYSNPKRGTGKTDISTNGTELRVHKKIFTCMAI